MSGAKVQEGVGTQQTCQPQSGSAIRQKVSDLKLRISFIHSCARKEEESSAENQSGIAVNASKEQSSVLHVSVI